MDPLSHLVDFFAQNGYIAVFLALIICGMGAPIPEDVTLVAGGVIAGLGYANVYIMLGVTMLGVLLGDVGMFWAGHRYGIRLLDKRPLKWLLTPERYASVQKEFERRGNRLLFTARFLPGMRTAIFISAGLTHRVSLSRFLLLDGMAALISVPLWVFLGYLGAYRHDWLLTWMHRGQIGLWTTLGIVALAVIITYLWRRKKRASAQKTNGRG